MKNSKYRQCDKNSKHIFVLPKLSYKRFLNGHPVSCYICNSLLHHGISKKEYENMRKLNGDT